MNRNLVSGIAAFALIVGATLAMPSQADAGGLFAKLSAKSCSGGLFSGKSRSCSGGFLSKLKAKRPSCGGGLQLFKGHAGGGFLAKLKARKSSSTCGGCGAPASTCGGGCSAPASTCGGCGAPASTCGGGCGAPAATCGGCAAPAATCGGCAAPVAVSSCSTCGVSAVVAAPVSVGCSTCGVVGSYGGEVISSGVVSGSSYNESGFDLAPGETLVPGSVNTAGAGVAVEAAPPAPADASSDI